MGYPFRSLLGDEENPKTPRGGVPDGEGEGARPGVEEFKAAQGAHEPDDNDHDDEGLGPRGEGQPRIGATQKVEWQFLISCVVGNGPSGYLPWDTPGSP